MGRVGFSKLRTTWNQYGKVIAGIVASTVAKPAAVVIEDLAANNGPEGGDPNPSHQDSMVLIDGNRRDSPVPKPTRKELDPDPATDPRETKTNLDEWREASESSATKEARELENSLRPWDPDGWTPDDAFR